jgi:hypothetical protein
MNVQFVVSSRPARRRTLSSVALSCALCATIAFAADRSVRYLSLADATPTLQLFAESGIPGSNITDSDAWDRWIREQDVQVRGRIDGGVEDSISNFILYGASYTDLPRFENPESALQPDGQISDAARARVNALYETLGSANTHERIRFIRDYLKRKGIARARTLQFLTANLQRFAKEQQAYQKKLDEAQKSGDFNQVLLTRGTLYENRGLSADTSLMTNYALEDTLRDLLAKGVLAEGKVRRIAVIGPGLDFTNKHNGYDFYPLQTIQPFAVMETALRLKLAKADDLEVITLDLNPAVNAHIAKLVQDAQAGRSYTVQLPRETTADWPPGAVAYWEHFGEIIGGQAKPLPVPQNAGAVTLRAVAVAPRFAARVTPLDVNIVAQQMNLEPGRGFDLVIATNILVYYDLFQQALAMGNIAHMMNPGGFFLSNDTLSRHHVPTLVFLDRHNVSFATTGKYGDNVLTYRRQ